MEIAPGCRGSRCAERSLADGRVPGLAVGLDTPVSPNRYELKGYLQFLQLYPPFFLCVRVSGSCLPGAEGMNEELGF